MMKLFFNMKLTHCKEFPIVCRYYRSVKIKVIVQI